MCTQPKWTPALLMTAAMVSLGLARVSLAQCPDPPIGMGNEVNVCNDLTGTFQLIGTTASIEEALNNRVPDTLDANYELVVAPGDYNEVMNPDSGYGIVISHNTFNPAHGLEGTEYRLTIRGVAGAARPVLGSIDSEPINRDRVRIKGNHIDRTGANVVTLKDLEIGNTAGTGVHAIHTGWGGGNLKEHQFVDPLVGYKFENLLIDGVAQGISVVGSTSEIRFNEILNVKSGIRILHGINYVIEGNCIVVTRPTRGITFAIRLWVREAGGLSGVDIIGNTLLVDASGAKAPAAIDLKGAGACANEYMPEGVTITGNDITVIGAKHVAISVDQPDPSSPSGGLGAIIDASDLNDFHVDVPGGAVLGLLDRTEAANLEDWKGLTGLDFFSTFNCVDPNCLSVPICVGPVCGDGMCDPGEDPCNCVADCGAPPSSETNCTDGVDEDCDGDIDCDDTDCDGDPACPQPPACDNDGLCDPGEDCTTCADCDGKTNGPPSGRYCCGNGILEGPEGDGTICNNNP